MGQAEEILKGMFTAYKQTSDYKDRSIMEIAARKIEFEKNLDDMWSIYLKGNMGQIVEYNKGVNQLKDLGFKVLRNGSGKHKIVLKG